MRILVQADPFDLMAETASLCRANPNAGAVASFLGVVRGQDGAMAVDALTLDHYPGMTEKSLATIVEEAMERWPLLDATVIHRVGKLMPGDPIVLVIVAAVHRAPAFAACEFIVDYLKTRAPFWKKESTPQGDYWVEARDADAIAADSWAHPVGLSGTRTRRKP